MDHQTGHEADPQCSPRRFPGRADHYVASSADFFKAIGPGERWITVKPPGHDKGQPLLIRDMPDGSSKVIGGAGGSMNHLRLTGVRSAADYKAEALSRAKNYREKRKRQAEQDRRDGLTASKSKAREAIRAEIGDHEVQFLKTVSDALGWKQEDMRFPAERYQNASPEAQAKAAATHARDLFRKAQEAVKFQPTIRTRRLAASNSPASASVTPNASRCSGNSR